MHIEDDRLQDYVDGLLETDQRAEVERHLALCTPCFESTQQLRALLDELSALPREVAPAQDLRPAIHAAISQRQVRPVRSSIGGRSLWSARYVLAAAALVLVAFSSIVTSLLVWRARDDGARAFIQATATSSFAANELRAIEANYIAATAELERTLREQRMALSPETVRILEENLAIIDAALAESRAALRSDPSNQALSEMIVAAYEKKLDLLRRAAELPTTRGGA
jgi:hypothetical protein